MGNKRPGTWVTVKRTPSPGLQPGDAGIRIHETRQLRPDKAGAFELGTAPWTGHRRDGAVMGEIDRHGPYELGSQRLATVSATVAPAPARCASIAGPLRRPACGANRLLSRPNFVGAKLVAALA